MNLASISKNQVEAVKGYLFIILWNIFSWLNYQGTMAPNCKSSDTCDIMYWCFNNAYCILITIFFTNTAVMVAKISFRNEFLDVNENKNLFYFKRILFLKSFFFSFYQIHGKGIFYFKTFFYFLKNMKT